MEKSKASDWYASDHGGSLVSNAEGIADVQKIMKRALDLDLREIGCGQGDIHQGNIILQIQKLRNVAAPKNKEDSRAAPRMLKMSLTDGKNNFQAVEVEHIASISLNTPPGTKFLLKPGPVPMSHGVILLRPANIAQVLKGRVTNLIEKWELNRKLASHTRVRSVEEGGPPPWIPFGKKIVKLSEQDKNFKALAEKEKPNKENTEFETQRKDAIAEAAKQGSKKIFGGGTKQLLDHSVQKIIDQGFSVEQAEYALKVNRNNVDRALKSLQKTETKYKEPRESRSKRFEKKSEESKPSSGKISLFDFLEDKLPLQHEPVEIATSVQNNHVQSSEPTFEGLNAKHSEMQGSKGGKTRGARGYQLPPRHSTEESKANKRLHNNSYAPTQYSQFNGGGNSQQNKPPRFQRNQEAQSYYQQDGTSRGNYQKSSQLNDYRNPFGQSRVDSGVVGDNGGYYKNQQDQGKSLSSNQNYNHLETDARNRQLYDASYGRQNRAQDGTHRAYPANTTDKNYKNQMQRYQPNDSTCGREVDAIGVNSQRSENHYNNNNQNNDMPTGSTWVWRVGDRCLAKYWEDNRYYNAVVTGLSDRTCVVQFKGFENYEEVLQIDCIPITEDDDGIPPKPGTDSKRQDQRFNRSSRNEQNQNHISGMEFRRGGSGAGPVNKGYGKKRGQRISQPIYQPPAQRSQPGPPNTQNNPLL